MKCQLCDWIVMIVWVTNRTCCFPASRSRQSLSHPAWFQITSTKKLGDLFRDVMVWLIGTFFKLVRTQHFFKAVENAITFFCSLFFVLLLSPLMLKLCCWWPLFSIWESLLFPRSQLQMMMWIVFRCVWKCCQSVLLSWMTFSTKNAGSPFLICCQPS